jgi:hypothetical protein
VNHDLTFVQELRDPRASRKLQLRVGLFNILNQAF